MSEKRLKFPIKKSVYELPVYELNLSARAIHTLQRLRIEKVEEIIDRRDEIAKARGCGFGTVKEILNSVLEAQLNTMTDEEVGEYLLKHVI